MSKIKSNDLIKLLYLYPEAEWNWDELSHNPNITWEFIQAHPEIKWWNWHCLSSNECELLNIPNLTWDIVKNNPNEKWNWHCLSSNRV